jgi:hypothetical protein
VSRIPNKKLLYDPDQSNPSLLLKRLCAKTDHIHLKASEISQCKNMKIHETDPGVAEGGRTGQEMQRAACLA